MALKNRILCSTGALIGRPNGRDYTLLSDCAERLSCDGFEFLMYDTWYDKLEDVKCFMCSFSAPVPVFHCEKQIGDLISRDSEGDLDKALELFTINCSLASFIGAEKLVLHLWSGYDSDKNIAHNIECYKYLNDIARTNRLTLTVENVVCNRFDPMSHLISLKKVYPDIQFTFDTKMAEFHGQLEALYDEKNSSIIKNISHMHINDYKGGYMDWSKLNTLHIGDGQIDFDRLFKFIKEKNYCGDLTVEATSFDNNGVIDYDKLNKTFDIIREKAAVC